MAAGSFFGFEKLSQELAVLSGYQASGYFVNAFEA